MAASTVLIANRALQKLGAKRISSLTQDHPNARSMNAAFESVRDAELRRYIWSFAIKRASIAADGTDETILNTWNRYSLPNDFIRLIRDDESGFYVDWKIEGLYILSATTSPLEIRYVARIEDPNYYDPLFSEALAAKLALECAIEIKDAAVTDFAKIEDSYDRAVSEARMVGAIEKEAQEFPEDPWLAARR